MSIFTYPRLGMLFFITLSLSCTSYSATQMDELDKTSAVVFYSGFDLIRPVPISEKSIEQNSCRMTLNTLEFEDYIEYLSNKSIEYNPRDISLKIVTNLATFHVDKNQIVSSSGVTGEFLKEKFLSDYGKLIQSSCKDRYGQN